MNEHETPPHHRQRRIRYTDLSLPSGKASGGESRPAPRLGDTKGVGMVATNMTTTPTCVVPGCKCLGTKRYYDVPICTYHRLQADRIDAIRLDRRREQAGKK